MSRKISYSEVQQHRSAESCWVILYGNVYDVTAFVPHHPGGSSIVLQLAGQDATEEFDPVHPRGTLEDSLPAESRIGVIDESTLPSVERSTAIDPAASTNRPDRHIATTRRYEIPDTVEDCLNLDDIEDLATSRISKKAWGYYYSASDDLRSKQYNNTVYQRILLRPRVFIDCTRCSTATSILGHGVNLPIFVSPAAMARLAHSDGEAGIARACAKYGAAQIISNNASMSVEDIVADAEDQQVFGWQLYIQDDRKKSERQLAKLKKLPLVKFIVLTLDAPVPGKREDDERQKNVSANLGARSSVQSGSASTTTSFPVTTPERSEKTSGGVGKALFAGTAADLTWTKTLPWLKQHTDLPVVLKGIQTHEDAYIAATHYPQIRGIILSNHGGRAADTAPPAIHTLLEIRKYCPEVLQKLEVFIDGGIKRGTDVVKALALGARAVGIGRSPLYGLGAGGQVGVERVLEILKAELETAMRLLGCETVDQLGHRHVNARAVQRDIFDGADGLEDALAKSRL